MPIAYRPESFELETVTTRGDRIRQAREAKRLSQAKLGDLVGVRSPTVFRWEKSDMRPEDETLDRLADALGVSAAWILYGIDEPRVEADHVDTAAWLELVDLGWLERYRERGLTPDQIEHVRRTPFRGAPTIDDYVAMLEAMVRELQRPVREAPEGVEGRAKAEREGTPKLKGRTP